MLIAENVTPEQLEAKRKEVQQFEEAVNFHFGKSNFRPTPSGDSAIEKLESLIAQTKSQEDHNRLKQQAEQSLAESRRELASLEEDFRRQQLQPQWSALHAEIEQLVNEANEHARASLEIYRKLEEVRQTKSELLRFGKLRFEFWVNPTDVQPFQILTPAEIATKQRQELTVAELKQVGL